VDPATCTGCGSCYQKCPVKKIPSEFDAALGHRTAIYTPFPQAVPNKPVIDAEHCLMITKGKCGVCAKICPTGAIRYDDQDTEVKVKVGAIVVATGFNMFDIGKTSQYGYKKLGGVYSAMEIERICASNGPTQGEITLRSGEEPKSVAIINCVGREEKGYCSAVCCMAALKLGHFLKNKLPELKITQFYSDLCIPGKAYQHFYQEVKESGVDFIRAEVTGVSESGKELAVKYKTDQGKENSLAADMVILNPALEPGTDSAKLAAMLNIPQGREGFFSEKEPDLTPIATAQDGIFIAGCAQGPKDIAETIAEAEATAGRILSMSG